MYGLSQGTPVAPPRQTNPTGLREKRARLVGRYHCILLDLLGTIVISSDTEPNDLPEMALHDRIRPFDS